jgi:hypothetical protein
MRTKNRNVRRVRQTALQDPLNIEILDEQYGNFLTIPHSDIMDQAHQSTEANTAPKEQEMHNEVSSSDATVLEIGQKQQARPAVFLEHLAIESAVITQEDIDELIQDCLHSAFQLTTEDVDEKKQSNLIQEPFDIIADAMLCVGLALTPAPKHS